MRIKKITSELFYCFSIVLLLGACRKDPDPIITEPNETKPTVNFTIDPPTEQDPFTYNFKGEAENYKDLLWTLGDDSTYSVKNFTHTYLKTGTFKVVLKATNKIGYWAQREATIVIRPQDVVKFSAESQGDGTLKLSNLVKLPIQSYDWYMGTTVSTGFPITTGLPVSTEGQFNIPELEAGDFKHVTLKIKTTHGSEAMHTRMVSNLGVLEDVTEDATITVSTENSSGAYATEGSLKFIDNNIKTKCLVKHTSAFWMQQQTKKPEVVNAYALVTANDVPNRDPKNWNLQGSMDGKTWVTLDTRSNITSDVRFQTKVYFFNNTIAYAYYRMNITAIRSGVDYQLAEWRLMRTP